MIRTVCNQLIRSLNTSTAVLGLRNLNMSSALHKKLDGKVAIVTASTAGIGFAIAQGLAENGAKVLISSRKQENVDKALEKLKNEGLDVSGTVCHVNKEEDRTKLIHKAVSDYGQLDILVSNAGVNPYFGPMLQTPESAWDKIFDSNVKCAFLLAKEVAPHLEKTRGSMLFVSSILGFNPSQILGAYSVSKTALLGLVKVLAGECAPMNIRVNGIAPGIIKTAFSSTLTETPAISETILNSIPLKRFGTPSECAGTAVFLSSDDASYITGEIISVTGGMQSRL